MTGAEALDLAAKAAGWGSWEYVKTHCDLGERPGIRAHAVTIMQNAALKAENERLREALESVVNACDQGKLTPLGGPCGMTIEAQIRGSVYNRVPAWPVEEARTALERIDHD